MHWYKRDPDAALAGMQELSWEERGAYNTILDLLYSRDGDLPDDDAKVARIMRVRITQWKRMKARLIGHGKIWSEGGKLTAKRVGKTLEDARNLSVTQREVARKRWQQREKTNEINDPPMPSGNASITTTTSRKKYISPKPEAEPPISDEVKPSPRKRTATEYSEEFSSFWQLYPDKRNNSKPNAWNKWRELSEADRRAAVAALPRFADYCKRNPDYRVVHAERYLGQRRFEGWDASPSVVTLRPMMV